MDKKYEYQRAIRDVKKYTAPAADLFGAVLLSTFLGYWLDKAFDTKPVFLLAGFILGIITGFRLVYQFVKNENNRRK